jgi:ubiquinone/menaquinone biosynthesis C-methylase UbiE
MGRCAGVLDAMFKPFQDMLVEAVAAGSRRAVLEVGCGTGGVVLAIARELGSRGDVVGIVI